MAWLHETATKGDVLIMIAGLAVGDVIYAFVRGIVRGVRDKR